MLDWSKLEIPKMDIQHYIYILFTLIYVCLFGPHWNIVNRKDLSVLAHENYICKLKQKKEN